MKLKITIQRKENEFNKVETDNPSKRPMTNTGKVYGDRKTKNL